MSDKRKVTVRIYCANIRTFKGDVKHHCLLSDPPYEYGFMDKSWDSSGVAYSVSAWKVIGRLLHPGAFALAYGGPRTFHRMASAIEDAGFIIHPAVFCWLNSQGFPKASRVKGSKDDSVWDAYRYGMGSLKPAVEPLTTFQMPYKGKAVESISRTGAGALNIDACRIEGEAYVNNTWDGDSHPFGGSGGDTYTSRLADKRWPANFILDQSLSKKLDQQSGITSSKYDPPKSRVRNNGIGLHSSSESRAGTSDAPDHYGDAGGASRFFFQVQEQLDNADPVFYAKKVSPKERTEGLVGTHHAVEENTHPTMKPIAANTYFAKLLLPPSLYAPRRLLVPFSGVGSEVIGAMIAGFEKITSVELMQDYIEIQIARLEYYAKLHGISLNLIV